MSVSCAAAARLAITLPTPQANAATITSAKPGQWRVGAFAQLLHGENRDAGGGDARTDEIVPLQAVAKKCDG